MKQGLAIRLLLVTAILGHISASTASIAGPVDISSTPLGLLKNALALGPKSDKFASQSDYTAINNIVKLTYAAITLACRSQSSMSTTQRTNFISFITLKPIPEVMAILRSLSSSQEFNADELEAMINKMLSNKLATNEAIPLINPDAELFKDTPVVEYQEDVMTKPTETEIKRASESLLNLQTTPLIILKNALALGPKFNKFASANEFAIISDAVKTAYFNITSVLKLQSNLTTSQKTTLVGFLTQKPIPDLVKLLEAFAVAKKFSAGELTRIITQMAKQSTTDQIVNMINPPTK